MEEAYDYDDDFDISMYARDCVNCQAQESAKLADFKFHLSATMRSNQQINAKKKKKSHHQKYHFTEKFWNFLETLDSVKLIIYIQLLKFCPNDLAFFLSPLK